MHVGAAIAVVIPAITGLASLWFARTLGKGRFELINGFKPEKAKDARALAGVLRICYSILGWALLGSAFLTAGTGSLAAGLIAASLIITVTLTFMISTMSKYYRL